MFYIGFWISIRSLLLSGASVQNFLQKTLTIFWNFPDLNPWKSPLIVKFYSLKKYRTNAISLRDSENVLSSNIWENLWIAVCITVKIYQYKRKCRDIDINKYRKRQLKMTTKLEGRVASHQFATFLFDPLHFKTTSREQAKPKATYRS